MCLLYKLYEACPRLISLHDLYVDFVNAVEPGRKPVADDDEPAYRCVPVQVF